MRSPATPLLALLAALLTGCGGGAEPELATGVRDLLAMEPSERLETPGVVNVLDPEQWADFEGRGWRHEHGWRRLGATEATLVLPAASPADRELEIHSWFPIFPSGDAPEPPQFPVALEVLLNGVSLGSVEVGPESGGQGALEAPSAAWIAGDNELILRTDPAGLVRMPDGGLAGPALGHLRYDKPRLVEEGTFGTSLPVGTGLRWRLEERGAAELRVAARAGEAGVLSLGVRRLDRGGRPLDEVPVEHIFQVKDGKAFDTAWTLPAAEGALVELEVSWTGDSPLTLTRLDLVEALDRPSPPIVLISIDTLAARHTSLYGYARDTTPRLAAFAKDALVFERASTNAPWTMPSYAALMSGYFPSSARSSPHLTDTHFARTLPARRWTLAEALGAAGYHTGAFIDSPNVSRRLGFGQGFEVYDETALDVPHGEPGGGLEAAAEAALAWLDRTRAEEPDSPWLLFLHANDVHGPYVPGEGERGVFRGDGHDHEGPDLWSGSMSGTFDQIPEHLLGSELDDHDPSAERLPAAPFAAAYDESIRTLDDLLMDFLEDLAERGVLDEAIVIITADHGEAFGEHGHLGHGLLYDEVLHVPLVVRLPRAATGEPPTTGRIDTPVQLVDLYPTLTELAGLAGRRDDLHGRSLVPLFEGVELEPLPTYAEGGLMRQSAVTLDGWKLIELHPAEGTVPWTMLTNRRLPEGWLAERAPGVLDGPLDQARLTEITANAEHPGKLLADLREALGGRALELYDLTADPGELDDLFAERPDKVAELLPHLEAAAARLEETRLSDEEGAVRLSDEDLAELEALGY